MDVKLLLERLAAARTDELVVCSVSTATREWYRQSQDVETSFYLQASMGLSSMFALGLAVTLPQFRVWNIDGDGSLAMNPGALLTLAELNPSNLVQIVLVNRMYRATDRLPFAGSDQVDFEAMARAAGIQRTRTIREASDVSGELVSWLADGDGFTFVAAEVEVAEDPIPNQPFDGPEMKYRFARGLQERGVETFGKGGV